MIYEKPSLIIRKSKYNSRLETILKITNQETRLFDADHLINDIEIKELLDENFHINITALNKWIENSRQYLAAQLELREK